MFPISKCVVVMGRYSSMRVQANAELVVKGTVKIKDMTTRSVWLSTGLYKLKSAGAKSVLICPGLFLHAVTSR